MKLRRAVALALVSVLPALALEARTHPYRAKDGMVVSQEKIASQVGADALAEGGTAVDAAVATAFALAVTHPAAGNIGGGGFMMFRSKNGEDVAYDFREMAPSGASPTMFLNAEGRYDAVRHHSSPLAVGVPGTVAGLHLAWKENGKLPWRRLVEPAIQLAREGFPLSDGSARSLKAILTEMKTMKYAASIAAFSKSGVPYEAGELLRQPDLARTLGRIAEKGPAGFYEGETAELLERAMKAEGGLITKADLKAYQAKRRVPVTGSYRGYQVMGMPPISSGGTALIEMLNVLEGYDLKEMGFGSSKSVHVIAEAMRRAFADRARYLGDPEFNPQQPVARLTSKEYAAELRKTIREGRASVSSPERFEWPVESDETTHLSVVDKERNAVSLTYTLEAGYGSLITVSGAGFLLNNEMGDFNAGPGLTRPDGLIGTEPNLARPGKRMLSSMTPSILSKDGQLFLVIGSPGGRTIINTVLLTILNVIDHGMNVQQAIDAPRFHHQWLPDRIAYEKFGLSPDTIEALKARGHTLYEIGAQGVAQGILLNTKEDLLEGGFDRRAPDSGAAGR